MGGMEQERREIERKGGQAYEGQRGRMVTTQTIHDAQRFTENPIQKKKKKKKKKSHTHCAEE